MPVKLSGELVETARSSAKRFHRSLTGQIEHWATIGLIVESQLSGDKVAQLLSQVGESMKINQATESVHRKEIAAVLGDFLAQSAAAKEHDWLDELRAKGVPLYGTTAAEPGKIVKREPAVTG